MERDASKSYIFFEIEDTNNKPFKKFCAIIARLSMILDLPWITIFVLLYITYSVSIICLICGISGAKDFLENLFFP